jgi:hypothetical protein
MDSSVILEVLAGQATRGQDLGSHHLARGNGTYFESLFVSATTLGLCDNIALGLGATGFASAGRLAAVQKSTGRASGNHILRCDTARAAVFLMFLTQKNRWRAPFRSQCECH